MAKRQLDHLLGNVKLTLGLLRMTIAIEAIFNGDHTKYCLLAI